MEERRFKIIGKSTTRLDLKRRFQKLALAHVNIAHALATCNEFIGLIKKWEGRTMPYDVATAFISAIIVSYACPFTDNNGVGILPKKWRVFRDGHLQQAHDDMIKLRNEHFAHTDADVHNITIIPNGCLPPEIGRKPPQVAYKIAGLLVPPVNVIRYRDVCADIHARLEIAAQGTLKELYEGMKLPRKEFILQFDNLK